MVLVRLIKETVISRVTRFVRTFSSQRRSLGGPLVCVKKAKKRSSVEKTYLEVSDRPKNLPSVQHMWRPSRKKSTLEGNRENSINFGCFPRRTMVEEELGAQNWRAEALCMCSNIFSWIFYNFSFFNIFSIPNQNRSQIFCYLVKGETSRNLMNNFGSGSIFFLEKW